MNKNIAHPDFDLDLRDLISIILSAKYRILAVTTFAAILSVIYSLSLSNIYTSKALLVEANDKGSLTNSLGSMSAIANIAGVEIPKDSKKSDEAIARIKSFNFFNTFILPEIKLENLLAVDKWIQDENKIIYKKNIFDESKNQWLSKKESKIPTAQQAYLEYTRILGISQNNKTGFITVSVNHVSPFIAKEWIDLIIKKINNSMQKEDDEIAIRSIEFLKKEAEASTLQETSIAISQLIEAQIRNLMISSASENYVFRVIDSPIVPEKKTSPSRAVICMVGTLLGFIFGVISSFFAYYRKNFKF